MYNFSGTDGAYPHAGLIQDASGNFYGTTVSSNNLNGTVFKFAPDGTLTTLHSFSGADGAYPSSRLLRDAAGNLYGATVRGGASNFSTVFKIDAAGTLTTLHSFNATDGAYPFAGLVMASDGTLYGVTAGLSQFGYVDSGTAYSISSTGGFASLHNFNYTAGSVPQGALIVGNDGNLYGTTSQGGANNAGTIFQLTPTGGFTDLHDFANNANSGAAPLGALVQDAGGNFYGTTSQGGANFAGTVFELDSGGGGNSGALFSYDVGSGQFSVRHTFTGADSNDALGPVTQASNGSYYGTTTLGGDSNLGSIYQYDPTTGALTTLYSFGGADGQNPVGNLIQIGPSLYGTTTSGGANSVGVFFSIGLFGQAFTKLHDFDFSGGYAPGSLVLADDGRFYGAATAGGGNNAGTIFQLTADGTFTKLHDFDALTPNPTASAMGARKR